jgi:hypothetical protein
MGEVLEFGAFATEVRGHLWVLKIEPAFQLERGIARFMWSPFTAELEPLSEEHVQLSISASGQLVRTVQYAMDMASVRLVADGISAIFEPNGDG